MEQCRAHGRPAGVSVAFAVLVVLCAATITVALAAGPGTSRAASALASPTAVPSFGSNPGNLAMFVYRPPGLPAGRPVVVGLHGCTQNAADYLTNTGWKKYADLWGFALVLPEQRSANNPQACFNWFEPADTTRDRGEALSIRQMVAYAVVHYGSAEKRVYVTGLSSGGAMAAAMLAAYPDVFAAGAVVAGLAYRCATDLVSALTCMAMPPTRAPREWGDAVRAAYPGYRGRYPRVEIWFGTTDTTVVPANADRLRDQWTDVWGVGRTPTSTSVLPGATTRYRYGDAVTVYRVTGIGHGMPVDPGTGVDQCGNAARYYLDSICSAYRSAVAWGLGPAA
jgi:poly(hydroxyalkanoate) depolymerase family esterase